jgi:hypothetical protein
MVDRLAIWVEKELVATALVMALVATVLVATVLLMQVVGSL